MYVFLCTSVCVSANVCAAAATECREERAEGGPLWVFVWLRLSSSLGKWKLNTPLQRSGYQVSEEERKGGGKKQGSDGRASSIGVERGTEMEQQGEKTVTFWAWELESEKGRQMNTKIGRKRADRILV